MGRKQRQIGVFGDAHLGGEIQPGQVLDDVLIPSRSFLQKSSTALEGADALRRGFHPGRADKGAFQQGLGGGGFLYQRARHEM